MSKEALEKSIDKWEKICRNRNALDKGKANCALCKKYWDNYCRGCPVFKEVGKSGCVGTPHEEWCDHLESYHDLDFDADSKRQKGCKICDDLAQRELDFLKSLRKYE